jgi:hypothetical protein
MLLAKVVPHWGSALIVGAVVGGIGWLLVGKAMVALQQADLTPRETVETLKEDATWMKEQIKSALLRTQTFTMRIPNNCGLILKTLAS